MTIGETLWVIACGCAAISLAGWLVGNAVASSLIRWSDRTPAQKDPKEGGGK